LPPDPQPAERRPTLWAINLFFGVGTSPTGVLLDSAARALADHGWHVEVITGRASYGDTVRTGQRFTGPVHRLYAGPRQPRGVLGRFLSWAAFYLGVAFFAFSRRLPDKVLIMTTPPFLHALFALRNLLARRKAQLILWNQDTYPDVLAAVGLLSPSSWLYRRLLDLERWGAGRVDRVLVLDEGMKARLEQHGGRNLHILPNWEIDLGAEIPAAESALLRRLRAARRTYRYLVLYTGNYGWGHNLQIVWDHLRRHPRQATLYFQFVGGGEKWSEVVQVKQQLGLECLDVAPYLPKAEVMALVREADFGLVALERSCVGLMSPSKIHSYLLSGKPLLYVGPPGSNVAEAIGHYGCGLRIDEHDPAAWDRCIEKIAAANFNYALLAKNAARAAANRYHEMVGTRDLVALVEHGRLNSGSAVSSQ
jgi:glycosyltransferase involved in cell wall biosynthesis